MKRMHVTVAVVATAVVFMILSPRSFAVASGPLKAADSGASFRDGPLGVRHARFQERMAKYLDLSQEQMAQIQELRKKHFADTRSLREDLMERRAEMRRLYTDSAASDNAIKAKAAEIGSLQQLLRDDMIRLRLEERNILTPDQLKKLSEFEPKVRARGKARIDG